MKKIQSILFLLLSFTIFTACESDDKNIFLELEKASIVTMKINNDVISMTGVPFDADVDANNIVRHEMSIYQQGVNDTVPYATYTEFPFHLVINRQDIASALSIDVNNVKVGDTFHFVGTSTAEDGTVYTIEEFNITGFLVNVDEMDFNSKAYKFSIDIVEEIEEED